MVITGIKPIRAKKYWYVTFIYRRKEYQVQIETEDGSVIGDERSVMTSQLEYFDLSQKIRKKHFEYFKEAVNARELVENKLTQ